MGTEAITQLIALAVAVLGIIWHQQRQTDKLRDQLTKHIDGVNTRLTKQIEGLDTRLTAQITSLDNRLTRRIDGVDKRLSNQIDGLRHRMDQMGDQLTDVKERLSRIEGYLGIGVPAEVAAIERREPL